MNSFDTDVLVIGAGPTGLTATVLLAELGVPTLTVGKHAGTAHTPRASITNQRTIEIFRDLGIEERVKAVGWPLSYLSNVIFGTSIVGMELARYRGYGSGTDRLSHYAAASPVGSMNIPQHAMEPVLLEIAQEKGAEVRFGHELVELEQDTEGVVSHIRIRQTGEQYSLRSRYVIGADGGNSRVADLMGIRFDGQDGLGDMINAWIEADLAPYTAYRPAVLYSLTHPDAQPNLKIATFVNVKPWSEWSVLAPWGAKRMPTEEDVLEIARRAIGDDTIDVRVKGLTTWQVKNMVAREYGRGRVFLAGDAAHRHPPAGGLGSNTSIQDGYNLAWKLAMVLAGTAGEELLESYHQERQPVGSRVVERAITSWEGAKQTGIAFGIVPGVSLEEGWATVNEIYADSARGRERRTKLRNALKLQDYRSNAIGMDLGQRYVSDAVRNETPAFPKTDHDPALFYDRTTRPGAYLPHAWIEHERTRVSTIDIIGFGRFGLIIGVGGNAWRTAALAVAHDLGLKLDICQIGLRCPYDDAVGDWHEVREIGDGGAILVRPDRYIAWRSSDMVDAPHIVLREVFEAILALVSTKSTSDPGKGQLSLTKKSEKLPAEPSA